MTDLEQCDNEIDHSTKLILKPQNQVEIVAGIYLALGAEATALRNKSLTGQAVAAASLSWQTAQALHFSLACNLRAGYSERSGHAMESKNLIKNQGMETPKIIIVLKSLKNKKSRFCFHFKKSGL